MTPESSQSSRYRPVVRSRRTSLQGDPTSTTSPHGAKGVVSTGNLQIGMSLGSHSRSSGHLWTSPLPSVQPSPEPPRATILTGSPGPGGVQWSTRGICRDRRLELKLCCHLNPWFQGNFPSSIDLPRPLKETNFRGGTYGRGTPERVDFDVSPVGVGPGRSQVRLLSVPLWVDRDSSRDISRETLSTSVVLCGTPVSTHRTPRPSSVERGDRPTLSGTDGTP